MIELGRVRASSLAHKPSASAARESSRSRLSKHPLVRTNTTCAHVVWVKIRIYDHHVPVRAHDDVRLMIPVRLAVMVRVSPSSPTSSTMKATKIASSSTSHESSSASSSASHHHLVRIALLRKTAADASLILMVVVIKAVTARVHHHHHHVIVIIIMTIHMIRIVPRRIFIRRFHVDRLPVDLHFPSFQKSLRGFLGFKFHKPVAFVASFPQVRD